MLTRMPARKRKMLKRMSARKIAEADADAGAGAQRTRKMRKMRVLRVARTRTWSGGVSGLRRSAAVIATQCCARRCECCYVCDAVCGDECRGGCGRLGCVR